MNRHTFRDSPGAMEALMSALTTTEPPTSPEFEDKIKEIIDARIDSLVGDQRFQAAQLFRCAEQMPLWHSAILHEFLLFVGERPVNRETLFAFFERVTQPSPSASEERAVNEWGYATLQGEMKIDGKPTVQEVDLDVAAVERETTGMYGPYEAVLEVLSNIDDQEFRMELIRDLIKVLRLRCKVSIQVPDAESQAE